MIEEWALPHKHFLILANNFLMSPLDGESPCTLSVVIYTKHLQRQAMPCLLQKHLSQALFYRVSCNQTDSKRIQQMYYFPQSHFPKRTCLKKIQTPTMWLVFFCWNTSELPPYCPATTSAHLPSETFCLRQRGVGVSALKTQQEKPVFLQHAGAIECPKSCGVLAPSSVPKSVVVMLAASFLTPLFA